MKYLILTNESEKDGEIRLDGRDYHYLVNVRRLAAGECFPALSANGEKLLIKIVSINNKIITGKRFTDPLNSAAAASSPAFPEPCLCGNKFRIILFQALPKGDKMDLIVRQAAESGVEEIVPFTAEFSVGKPNMSGQKSLRWERIIKEARQQSGSKTATGLHSPLSMNELFDYWKKLKNSQDKEPPALGLLFHHEKGVEMNTLHGYLNNNPKVTVLVIGPEGGFSEREVSLFIENGFKLITTGDTVLRTETAALYCTAAVRTLLLEKNSWELKQT